jgi:hypothetical protein
LYKIVKKKERTPSYSYICLDIREITKDKDKIVVVMTRTGTKGFGIKIYSVTFAFLGTE